MFDATLFFCLVSMIYDAPNQKQDHARLYSKLSLVIAFVSLFADILERL
jgi:flagellar biogenesis protein FliO